ncbi:MAG: ROK family protein [Geminicoccales bacterium]
MRTLTIDIGGTGIKLLPIDSEGRPLAERHRELTPKPSTPAAVMGLIESMVARQEPFDRVSVGFPGVVMHGVVKTAPNLGTEEWCGFDLQKAIARCARRPTRTLNDADLQGYGVIEGKGVELVLTLGTGLGTGLYVDGHLVPNLELAHHPLRNGKTYEDLVSDAELERIGEEAWCERVDAIIEALRPIFNYDILHIGGGNAGKLRESLPENVHRFESVAGLAGGIRLWQDENTK